MAQLLIALFSVRSDWAFCGQVDYSPSFRWFLDMSQDEVALDRSASEADAPWQRAALQAQLRRARAHGEPLGAVRRHAHQ
jgi:hypothetical protein